MSRFSFFLWPLLFSSISAIAECLSAPDIIFFGQMAYINRHSSFWRIEGKEPYRTDNVYNDIGIRYGDSCQLIDNRLSASLLFYGFAYHADKKPGRFEQDKRHQKITIGHLAFTYTPSESVKFEIGKLSAKPGLFFIKSPVELLSNYDAGFKSTRIYDPALKGGMLPLFGGQH